MKEKLFLLFNFLLISTKILPQELSFEKLISSYVIVSGKKYPYYIVFDEEKKLEEIFIESIEWTDKIYGYGGPINLQIYFSKDGKIKRINVLEHYETKEFTEEVFSDKFLSQYYNKDIKDKFIIGKDIKAVSGATISCTAINEIVSQCVQKVNEYLFSKKKQKGLYEIHTKEIIKSLLVSFLFLISIIAFIKNISAIRIAVMLTSIIFLGFFSYGGVSFDHIRNLLFLNFPSFKNLFFWILILLTLFGVVFFGRLYCGWLCPFGALSEFLFRIKKFIETRYKKSLGKEVGIEFIEDNVLVKYLRKFEKYYRYVKYIILLIILFLPAAIILEPFYYTFVFYKSSLIKIIYSVFILIFCIIFIRIWCRYFCPLGGFLALFSKISLFRLKFEDNNCLRCEICKISCPMNAIVEQDKKLKILHSECILCNICRKICGPKAIRIEHSKFIRLK
ncbi:MAG: FMN-binding protein [Elusimicrobiota bacterium]|nr:FMN-binding protein [Endomicrobiia bacterium]MDW8165293.1 FMN-binding protein [Elusimicrobiota bacterium]